MHGCSAGNGASSGLGRGHRSVAPLPAIIADDGGQPPPDDRDCGDTSVRGCPPYGLM